MKQQRTMFGTFPFAKRLCQGLPGAAKQWLAALALVAIAATNLQAGKYAATFMDIGVGARGLGLGGAYISLTNGVYAFHWNPSGLALLQRPQFAFMYASQFGSLADPLAQYNYLGGAIPLPGNTTFSVNWIRLASGQIPLYPELAGDNLGQRLRNPELRPDGQPAGYFSDNENAYYFTFAKLTRINIDAGYGLLEFPVEIPIGINLKLIQQNLYEESASGFGIDIGAMLRVDLADMLEGEFLGKLAFGFQFNDISTTVLTWKSNYRDEILPRFRWGMSYEQPVRALKGSITFAWQSKDRYETKPHFGVELNSRSLFLRIGTNDGKLTAGTGIALWKLQIDYAFIGYELGNVHRLSGAITL